MNTIYCILYSFDVWLHWGINRLCTTKTSQNVPKLKILGLELTTYTGVVKNVDKRVQKTNKSSSPSPVQSQLVLVPVPCRDSNLHH